MRRGSESRRLSLTHCNVSTFLSGSANLAASLSNFSWQRPGKNRRGKSTHSATVDALRTRFLREPPFPPAAPPQDHLYYRYRDGRESPENVIKSVSTAFYRAHTAGSCCAIVLAPQTNVWMPPRSNENPDFEIVRSDGRETPRSIPPYL